MSAPAPKRKRSNDEADVGDGAAAAAAATVDTVSFPNRCDQFTTVDPLDEALACCIRLGVLHEPLQHKACGNCVCRVCLIDADWKCPICSSASAASEADYVQPAKPLLQLLDKIQVVCPGCTKSIEHGSLRHHASTECIAKERFTGLALQGQIDDKCIVCSKMFAAPGQKQKCSRCFVTIHAKDDHFGDHPLIKRYRFGPQRDWCVQDLDAHFQSHKPGHVILSPAQATMFIRTYKTKSLEEMLAAFNGKREFQPFVLRATDADRLLIELGSRVNSEYRLMHLIAPRTLDRWAITRRTNVMECYHLAFGELKDAPVQLNRLHELWLHIGTDYVMH